MKRLDVFRTDKTGVSKESPADETLQDFLFGNMGTVPVFCILLETQEPSLCFFVSEKADDMKYFVSAQLQDQLKFFAECFERIHNRPTYGIK
ncbi:hypothetical protein ACFRCQ_13205 [Cytobacillus firmus]|uniref:hypothetical protein n=1 Tax=Cytobacillus firmus TaxID=1399 RepID=UPI003699C0E3